MGYMQVISQTDRILHLSRSPGLRGWSTFIGILSIGIGMMIFSGDSPTWKIFCLVCCLFVSFCSLDDWEECIFDKTKGEVTLKKFSLVERVLKPTDSQRHVQANLDEIAGVGVEQEDIRFFGRGKCVLLNFVSGFSLPLTEKCTLGNGKEHIAIADTIGNFLDIDPKLQAKQAEIAGYYEEDEEDSASLSSPSASEADCEDSTEGEEEEVEMDRVYTRISTS